MTVYHATTKSIGSDFWMDYEEFDAEKEMTTEEDSDCSAFNIKDIHYKYLDKNVVSLLGNEVDEMTKSEELRAMAEHEGWQDGYDYDVDTFDFDAEQHDFDEDESYFED